MDFTQTASAIVSQSIGEGLFDGKPLPLTLTRAKTPLQSSADAKVG
jgi:hypothetical protein